jgi:hypothetical protein
MLILEIHRITYPSMSHLNLNLNLNLHQSSSSIQEITAVTEMGNIAPSVEIQLEQSQYAAAEQQLGFGAAAYFGLSPLVAAAYPSSLILA